MKKFCINQRCEGMRIIRLYHCKYFEFDWCCIQSFDLLPLIFWIILELTWSQYFTGTELIQRS